MILGNAFEQAKWLIMCCSMKRDWFIFNILFFTIISDSGPVCVRLVRSED